MFKLQSQTLNMKLNFMHNYIFYFKIQHTHWNIWVVLEEVAGAYDIFWKSFSSIYEHIFLEM